MDRDRELSLLRQAHVEGYLDCKDAQLSDRRWWRKVDWTLNWLEKHNRNEVRRLSHEQNCALLSYDTGAKLLDLHWDQSFDIQHRFAKTLLPWEKIGKPRFSRSAFKDMVKMWETIYGDRNDPETQKKIQATADWLNAQAMPTLGTAHG